MKKSPEGVQQWYKQTTLLSSATPLIRPLPYLCPGLIRMFIRANKRYDYVNCAKLNVRCKLLIGKMDYEALSRCSLT